MLWSQGKEDFRARMPVTASEVIAIGRMVIHFHHGIVACDPIHPERRLNNRRVEVAYCLVGFGVRQTQRPQPESASHRNLGLQGSYIGSRFYLFRKATREVFGGGIRLKRNLSAGELGLH